MDADSDASLVTRARDGDREAFGLLVQRYMRRAYAQALGLVGSREDALDLSQEAFARAFRARSRLDPERPFYAWVYQILRRLCFNHLRQARARRRVFDPGVPDWVTGSVPERAAADPAARLLAEESRRVVGRAIDRLPAREREVLVMKDFEDLKYREIAELIGVPIGTVMSRLYSARRHLAESLESMR